MTVIGLGDIGPDMAELVGGKALGLGALLRAGERVPEGFCVTTDAYAAGDLPEAEILAAYEKIGEGRVAVRSSATAEDQADASFAGQQDTYLNVDGRAELLDAVRRCWASLDTERAVAYRSAGEIARDTVRMAVVVQRMVEPRAAGVLFTANPITGCRGEMVVDAAEGLGTTVVDGGAETDHYVLNGSTPEGGCLRRGELEALRESGSRLQRLFGGPQDIEWAIDAAGTLWLLQSRPVTTLFPEPPRTEEPRVYLEAGNMQGMLRPFTPMGLAAMQRVWSDWCESYDVRPKSGIVAIGGRMFIDLTTFVRTERFRGKLIGGTYGPRVEAALSTVLEDPRFAPRKGMPFSIGKALRITARTVPAVLAGLTSTLARPVRARTRAFAYTKQLADDAAGPRSADPKVCIRRAETAQAPFVSPEMTLCMLPLFTGILAGSLPVSLLRGLVDEDEVRTVLGGLPHNVTTEMNLALWRVAEAAGEHRELLVETPPDRLAEAYRAGELPEFGLTEFLAKYGHRAAAEVDVGIPRWAEDPSPVFATLANYLRITDPEEAPDRRFEQAATRALAKLEELAPRVKRARPIRGRMAVFLLRRARELTGLRELGKFTWLYMLAEVRAQLLLAGELLTERGLLEDAGDIMFLDFAEAYRVADGEDARALIHERKAEYARERRRPNVPVAILSDGTIPETLAKVPAEDGALTGMSAAPGNATGPARVIHDPNGAHIEPGEILVAPTTDPGWTPLFMSAAGLVTETGSPMAHGPTVAREYGIPAVICVRDATSLIQTGQLITVDAATGSVSYANQPD